MASNFEVLPNLKNLECFKHFSLKVDSQSLQKNPLKDVSIRYNQGLLPKKEGSYTAIFVLSGFSSEGSKNFNFRSFENSFVQDLDLWALDKTLDPQIYIFVEAWTLMGGSQFINSAGCGRYEDYIVTELVPALKDRLPKGYEIKSSALLGGSSGGYGALHLSSKYPDVFSKCFAIAPDVDFEISLKQELYHLLYLVEPYGGFKEAFKAFKLGQLNTKKRSFHQLINAMAMAACYSTVDEQGVPNLPLDKEGVWDENLWSLWLEKDPLNFLRERSESLKKLDALHLTVGSSDQFLLQYGARKLHSMFKSFGVDHVFEEFEGNHFDLGKQRKKVLNLI